MPASVTTVVTTRDRERIALTYLDRLGGVAQPGLASVLEALATSGLEPVTRFASRFVDRAEVPGDLRAEVDTGAIGSGREGSLSEVAFDELTEDVVTAFAAPADEVLGVNEDPAVVSGDTAAGPALAAVRDLARIVVVADVGLAGLGHRQDGLVRESPSRKSIVADHPMAPLAREKSARE